MRIVPLASAVFANSFGLALITSNRTSWVEDPSSGGAQSSHSTRVLNSLLPGGDG